MTPDGWTEASINEVCVFRRGLSWKKDQERDTPGSGRVPVLRIPNVKERLNVSDLLFIEGVSPDQVSRARVTKGWCVMVGSNGNPARVGNCVPVDEPADYLFASFLVGVGPLDSGRIDSGFMYRILRSARIQADIAESVQGSTGLKNINLSRLKAFRVVLPPLAEQRKIAAILSSVDDAIEGTQAVIDQLQVVKKAMMTELLARGLPGRHTQFKQTEIGEVPEGWALRSIDELGLDSEPVVRTGPFGSSLKTKDFRPHGVQVLTIQSLGEGEILYDGLFFVDNEKAAELAEYKVKLNDVVFSRVADIGRCAAIGENEVGWIISSNLSRIRLNPQKADARFLMYLITIGDVVRRQVEMVAGNAGRPVITSTTLKELRLPLPSIEEQIEVAAAGRALEHRISAETFDLISLQEVKSALMSALLAGEIRVTLGEDPT